MEVLVNDTHILLKTDTSCLACDRKDGTLTAIPVSQLRDENEYKCIGAAHGLVGLFDGDKLVLISKKQCIGSMPDPVTRVEHEVFKIQKICALRLTTNDITNEELTLDICEKHASPGGRYGNSQAPIAGTDLGLQRAWSGIKSATNSVRPGRAVGKPNNSGDTKERYERRLLEELYKMFNGTDSFYFSAGDITNSLQRQHKMSAKVDNYASTPLYKRVDDRFFWNKYMVSQLLESDSTELHSWILPIMQGCIQIERCFMDSSTSDITSGQKTPNADYALQDSRLEDNFQAEFRMILISRRSRFRAGTRYKRRGVDEEGHCANYVETEQIFEYAKHLVSFVQVRGSVPVYWSQPGYKYRPPPKLDRNEQETQIAFEKHFNGEISSYGEVICVNLVEQTGREQVISDAYLKHILNFDSSNLVYVTFDFHEYCRGMRFEYVSILIENIKDLIKEVRYLWLDEAGAICEQIGTFRVNCIDCLDRTNIVMTAIARTVMDIQLVRLGLLPPEGNLPSNSRRTFQLMWANNGDIISRQYAGTAALKGDFTRSGERRLAGMMKDSYNSATRYYLNRFRDAYRQATIDIMLGNPVNEDLNSPENESSIVSNFNEQEHHERIKSIIEDCKKILIPEEDVVLGGWPLVDADPADGLHQERDMDTVLILTKDSYYVAEYDEETDRITRYQRVLLEDLEKIELGPEPNSFFSVKHKLNYCIRLHYLVVGQSGYFHMFRSTNTRFFNNMAISITTPEESMESLRAICESFKVALSVKSLNVPFYEGKLEKRKSKLTALSEPRTRGTLSFRAPISLQRASEGQLRNLKSAGTRALSGVSSHFARLKGKWAPNARQTLGPLNEPHSPVSTKVTFYPDAESSEEEDSVNESVRRIRKRRHKDQLSVASTSSGVPLSISERTLSSDYSECSDIEDSELATPMVEVPPSGLPGSQGRSYTPQDGLLESCGILATSPPLSPDPNISNVDAQGNISQQRKSTLADVDDFVLESMKKISMRQLQKKASDASSISESPTQKTTPTPQIQITDDDYKETSVSAGASTCDLQSSNLGVVRSRQISKSSEDLDHNSNSSQEFGTQSVQMDVPSRLSPHQDGQSSRGSKMKTSHSETAIGQEFTPSLSLNLPNPLSSPILIKKDLVLSPLSRIARGVQSLGMNIKTGTASAIYQGRPSAAGLTGNPEIDENLRQRKVNSKTRIIDI